MLSMSDTDRSDRLGYRISALRGRGVPYREERSNVEGGGFEEMPGVFAGGTVRQVHPQLFQAIAAGKVIASQYR